MSQLTEMMPKLNEITVAMTEVLISRKANNEHKQDTGKSNSELIMKHSSLKSKRNFKKPYVKHENYIAKQNH